MIETVPALQILKPIAACLRTHPLAGSTKLAIDGKKLERRT
jgi:hypothetical protein